ncbi:MAG: 50S ribosomal protein L2 [Candidatus Brockarchaeota archaeon]|nr:50S ribosomal protein L2 [Candidatus Brockarchaeota archaeon]
MGKRPIVRRRGASPIFEAPTHRRVGDVRYVQTGESTVQGEVKGLLHDPGRGSPVAEVRLDSGERFYMVAGEGMYVGQRVEVGAEARLQLGSVLPLGKIPEGTMVFNVERKPEDGGALFRSSGNYAVVVGRAGTDVMLKDSSGRIFTVDSGCKATLGVAAGGGRIEKPFLKAGTKMALMRSRGRLYPRVRGVAMISAYHPFGGGRHQHAGGARTVPRGAPPGKKMGLIAAKRTGRGRRRAAKQVG